MRRAAEAFALGQSEAAVSEWRKRELLQLLRSFSQQHEDGICQIKSFRQLLRLEYLSCAAPAPPLSPCLSPCSSLARSSAPPAPPHLALPLSLLLARSILSSRWHPTRMRPHRLPSPHSPPQACNRDISAMLDFVKSVHDFEAAATQAAEARQRDIEAMFKAIDTDMTGSIDETEFVTVLGKSTECRATSSLGSFAKRTPIRPGALDRHEFVELVKACDLLNHHEKILAEGAATRERREREKREKQDLWRIGLPDRGRRSSIDRPSLLAVSADQINQRKERPSLVGGFKVLSWETDDGKKVTVGL